ncbi:helix-turn-helix domain-containing protein [Haladaptatus sp. T7]|uniref:helix-turn-helix domain-containing protein n=1 Tax=Haladaptatus sp. T7 TaxID=2029368 RepID=UPI0021A25249|nr:helix-turn-helix domain-containing protein [Haladaptatus sp. T7]GKZ14534.1 helix-turn-helix domain-containing protein [Haladaptatus sp. T7]
MATAKLTLTLPAETWIGDVSTTYPDAKFRVLAALPADDIGVGLLELTAADLPPILREMDDHDGIVHLDLLRASDDTCLVEFETTDPLLLLSVQESAVPLELPLTITDGDATFEVTAARDRLSALATQLDLFGVPFEVEYVREMASSESLLTDRQQRLVRTAVECGYYDSPRTCTLTELAAMTDVAKSTASETLHRAEGTIIKRYVTDEVAE